ncbi:MAG TPA: hypothetical protein VLD58_16625 [Gemmatimonadales bacterium]|nr:hypothetical protein [Gemmatimonadales bacterium]
MIPPLAVLALLTDTLRIVPSAHAPVFDGRADSAEYGVPSVTIRRPAGTVQLWLRIFEGSVYLAARLPDSTFYWGDDLVISLDTRGDRAAAPQHDDFQWYFRRVLDSSVVFRGDGGRWQPPLGDPDWTLGKAREGGGWEVRSVDDGAGWSLELKLDQAYFGEAGAGNPGLAFRVYDNDPHGWQVWPAPAGLKQATEVERRPALWAVVTRP